MSIATKYPKQVRVAGASRWVWTPAEEQEARSANVLFWGVLWACVGVMCVAGLIALT